MKLTFALLLALFTIHAVMVRGADNPAVSVYKNDNIFKPLKIIVSNDDIYLLDKGDQSVKVFSQKGGFIRSMGKKGEAPGEFLNVTDFALANDKIYVLDKFKIETFNKKTGSHAGGYRLTISSPLKLYVEKNDVYIVAISVTKGGKLIHHLIENKGELNPVASFRDNTPLSGGLMDIYLNFGSLTVHNGHIYFAQMISNKVQAFSSKGEELPALTVPITPLKLDDLKIKKNDVRMHTKMDKGILIALNSFPGGVYLLAYDQEGVSIIFKLEPQTGKAIKVFQVKEKLASICAAGNDMWAIGLMDDELEVLRYKLK